MTAKISYITLQALGAFEPKISNLLAAYLDPDISHDFVPPDFDPLVITPLEFQLYNSIDRPIPLKNLPIKFASLDLEDPVSWANQINAAERLVKIGSLPTNLLLQAAAAASASAAAAASAASAASAAARRRGERLTFAFTRFASLPAGDCGGCWARAGGGGVPLRLVEPRPSAPSTCMAVSRAPRAASTRASCGGGGGGWCRGSRVFSCVGGDAAGGAGGWGGAAGGCAGCASGA